MKDNVVQMPARLERDACQIREGLAQWGRGREEMIGGMLKVCLGAFDARTAHHSDQAFGKWWDAQDFRRPNGKPLNSHERAAAIALGAAPDLQEILAQTNRTSLHTIHLEFRYEKNFKPTPGVESNPKEGRRESKRGQNTPIQDRARGIVREKLDAKEPITPHKLQKQHGISHVTFDMAITAEIARKEALDEVREEALAEAAEAVLSKTAREKLDIADRRRAKKLEEEFEGRVQAEAQRRLKEMMLPHFDEQYRFAQAVLAGRKGVFTKAEYTKILRCLHPDHVNSLGEQTVKLHNEALIIFRTAEIKLLDERESPHLGKGTWRRS